jgi:hypothetical protein
MGSRRSAVRSTLVIHASPSSERVIPSLLAVCLRWAAYWRIALACDQVSTSFAMASSETVQVPERKQATFGVGIARLGEWIEEDLTGQERLPGLA